MSNKGKKLREIVVSLVGYLLVFVWIAVTLIVPITLIFVCINWLHTIF